MFIVGCVDGCDVFEPPQNATVLSENSTTVILQCNTGFQLKEGDLIHRCQNGKWGKMPFCSRKCLITCIMQHHL